MTEFELKNLAEKLTQDEIIKIATYWTEEQSRWNNHKIRDRYYLENGSFGDLFLHEIISFDPNSRTCFVVDLSQFSRPTKYIDYLPEAFPTQEKASEYYSKKYPAF